MIMNDDDDDDDDARPRIKPFFRKPIDMTARPAARVALLQLVVWFACKLWAVFPCRVT